MADFDREASRVRRDEIRASYGEPFSHASVDRLLNELVEVLNQAEALESLLVAADREVAELRAKIAAALNIGPDEEEGETPDYY